MSTTDQNTSSPRGALSRLRRNKGTANGSANSLSTDDNESSESAGGLRASMDAAVDRVKERTKRAVEDGRSGNDTSSRRGSNDNSGRRLSNLIPRRKRSTNSRLSRNLSAQSGDSGDDRSINGNRSESSLLDGSGRSSLLTEDNSDHEGKLLRPTLSPHQSHAGLLTLSSPELNSQSRPVSTANGVALLGEELGPSQSYSSIPNIVEPSNTEPLPIQDAAGPGVSSAGRFKKAFTLPRKQQGGDADSVKSSSSNLGGDGGGGGTGGGLGGLFNRPRSRASSVSSKAQDTASDKPLDEASRGQVAAPDPEVSVPVLAEQREAAETLEASTNRPETPKQTGRTRINTSVLPATPPNLVETPTTFVTPPTPTDPNAGFGSFPDKKSVTSAPRTSSPTNRPLSSIESIRHRRAQSANLPSKLSNALPAPLTPTVEETKTPGGTLTQPIGASGFFTNFISAAQKAADQLSNNINTINSQNKVKSATPQAVDGQGGEEVIPGAKSQQSSSDPAGEKKQPAVDTLGTGDLNLGHLGISESQDVSPMNSAVDLQQPGVVTSSEDRTQKAEEEAAARAVSTAYEKPVQSLVSQANGRPVSIASNDRLTLNNDDQTPPRSGTDGEGIKRTSSVRSKLSGRRRRHRASSATTGTNNTIATALQSSATGLANPGAYGAGHRLTGFAVASSKRNKDFHSFFRSVPEDDYLIEDYSAALQRDILLHGRLYVSEGHICFSSNILGWVTNLVIGFDEVVSVEKKNTAVIFPNAIVIQTLQARNTFASLVARDSTYELLIGIWKISHPNLKSSLNGVTLVDAGTGDKTEVADPEGSDAESDGGSDDEVYDEDEDDDGGSFTEAGMLASAAGSDVGDTALSRKTSAAPVSSAPQTNGSVTKAAEATQAMVAAATGAPDFPGSQSHAPTECSDSAEHYERPLTDTIIPAPLGKVYSLMWGPASGAFMRKWFEEQKARDINYPDDKIGLDNDHKTMLFDYIKPLNAPVGPRQTKCITTNTLTSFDLDKAVCVDCSTQTPDVPSGSVFTTKTRYCLMWGPENSTRMIANCSIEWTGKSWLKGPIEKGANDGQTEYVKAMVASLKAAVMSKAPAKGPLKKGKRKGKKEAIDEGVQIQRDTSVADKQQAMNWGLLEPLHGILGPIFGIISPFITSQTVIAVLFVLLMYTWLLPPRMGANVGLPAYGTPGRFVAYEELWRKEESNLWDWLEDRVGLDHLYAPSISKGQQDRQRTLNARSVKKGLEAERMNQRQMDDAIRVTEERLSALKEAVESQKEKRRT